ncbi:MFS transporter [Anaerobacillus alkaliphilus]|uniref:MFS transporter n=1 Tax=Anaerobacillus alkaliphilus TaxID=1548597 RepID=A0A4V1LGJ8_9BACI|nr:MFS transporter [Anaerobacillus alkaliphilus]RXJ01938.1 MFS transporter [Anaerobacillus alkaliphilus]
MENPKENNIPYTLSHILIIFAMLAILIVSNLYIMIPLLGNVATTFSISTSEASLSISVFSFFYACGLIFFGPLSERFGLKETICTGLFVLIILMAAGFFMTNFSTLLLLRALQGFWAASFAPVSFIYVLNVLNIEHRGIAIGVINTGFLSAGVIGQLLSSSVNIVYGWQSIFLTLAILYSFLLIYSLNKLPRPRKQKQSRSIPTLLRTIISIPFRQDLKRLYFITFTTLLAFVAYYTALENFFSTNTDATPSTTLMVRGFGLIGLIITIYSTKIGTRFGYENTILFGLTLKLIGLLFSGTINVYLIAFGSIVFVAGVAIIIPSLIQLIGYKGGHDRSLTISMYSFILLLGASFGSGITVFSSYFIQLFTLATLLFGSFIIILIEKSGSNIKKT